ncbi:HNH endonuclease signature motif containing protein [Runella sp. SP2]|uniref:HNH endonuclease signature motif containing protein n=1 Tax=Runella sp. SP2 TaxID=2268026 RepID=UPI001E426AAA|nr:HNH endonuclease [Runella sp. SP2]
MQPDLFAYISHQIDHIISIKHGGENNLDNLAYACFQCNVNKGSDIGTVLLPDRTLIRLYNPRIDYWHDHFEIENGVIYPKTTIGQATIKILDFNDVDRILERQGD